MKTGSKNPLRICVIGDGGWGTALALTLHANGHAIRVWGPFPAEIEAIRRDHENRLYLPGVQIPAGLQWTCDREEACRDAELVVMAVPSKFFRTTVESFAGILPRSCLLVSVTKGLDPQTLLRMSQVAESIIPHCPVTVLSGPSFAPEVARGIPTAVVAAARDEGHTRRVQSAFSNPCFRVYTSTDVTGVEIGGALKNVIALAAGVSDGLGFGDNTRSALITRGLAEIRRMGVALGASATTFAGLSGIGDLMLTCNSRQSRNHQVGERLGRGEPIRDILAGMKQVAEGVQTCQPARDLARRHGLSAPITDEVCAVVHEGKSPIQALNALMSRENRPEAD